jgi:hypothetical protein
MRNCQPPDALPLLPVPAGSDADRINLRFRIKNEYEEMPGLCLTRTQAQKLWGLDAPACDDALAALVSEGYRRKAMMGYVRA